MSALAVVLMISVANLCAQQKVVVKAFQADDKDIQGVWIMESMQFDGEKKTECGKSSGYTQFKYYGADGEYACAQIFLNNSGKVIVSPHEYGTYTYKDGWYSEMGREKQKDNPKWIDKDTTAGRWKNRNDIWKRVKMSDATVRYIVDCCKAKVTPDAANAEILDVMFK